MTIRNALRFMTNLTWGTISIQMWARPLLVGSTAEGFGQPVMP
jgi:hypothetical protein